MNGSSGSGNAIDWLVLVAILILVCGARFGGWGSWLGSGVGSGFPRWPFGRSTTPS
jgi:hypothetical protein